MRQRKKKKAFKKRFGFNPPRNISIQMATRIMEYKEYIIVTFERLKAAILDLWESIKKTGVRVGRGNKGGSNGVYIRAGAKAQAVYSVGGFPNKGIIAAAAAGKRGKAD